VNPPRACTYLHEQLVWLPFELRAGGRQCCLLLQACARDAFTLPRRASQGVRGLFLYDSLASRERKQQGKNLTPGLQPRKYKRSGLNELLEKAGNSYII